MYAQMLVGMVAFAGQWWLDVRKPKLEDMAAALVNLAWNGLSTLDTKPKISPEARTLRERPQALVGRAPRLRRLRHDEYPAEREQRPVAGRGYASRSSPPYSARNSSRSAPCNAASTVRSPVPLIHRKIASSPSRTCR